MVRAGLYARVSTSDQQTLAMQNRAMREYAARRGWAITMQIREVSSGAVKREAREKLLEAACARTFGLKTDIHARTHAGLEKIVARRSSTIAGRRTHGALRVSVQRGVRSIRLASKGPMTPPCGVPPVLPFPPLTRGFGFSSRSSPTPSTTP